MYTEGFTVPNHYRSQINGERYVGATGLDRLNHDLENKYKIKLQLEYYNEHNAYQVAKELSEKGIKTTVHFIDIS